MDAFPVTQFTLCRLIMRARVFSLSLFSCFPIIQDCNGHSETHPSLLFSFFILLLFGIHFVEGEDPPAPGKRFSLIF